MEIGNNRAYCPYCKGERELVRPKISIAGWIVVSIFTAGIGIVAYPIAHYMFSNKTRCHTCQGKIAKYWNRKPMFEESKEDGNKD